MSGEESGGIVLKARITCPTCGHLAIEIMPTDTCQYFYDCRGCGRLIRPKVGDCCVYCSHADTQCPPVQEQKRLGGGARRSLK
jgi:hypothetical protein